MKKHVLTTVDLSVKYGRRAALDSVSLEVKNVGNIVGLFGPNGAGKTTLIRSVAGLIQSYKGTIHSPSSTSIAYLPDHPFLYKFLTINECVDLYRSLFKDFDSGRALDMLSDLSLGADLKISECSKGMGEQVHLALTLARRSSLYLLDEPLAAVDPLTRDVLIEMIQRRRHVGSTVILSTHLITGLDELFDESVVVADGRLVLHEVIEDHISLESKVKEVLSGNTV